MNHPAVTMLSSSRGIAMTPIKLTQTLVLLHLISLSLETNLHLMCQTLDLHLESDYHHQQTQL